MIRRASLALAFAAIPALALSGLGPAFAQAGSQPRPNVRTLPAPTPPAAQPVQVAPPEPDLPRTVNYAILRPWRSVNDTIVYNQGLMIDNVATQIINRRLITKARAGGTFLDARIDRQKMSRTVDGTFVSVAPIGPAFIENRVQATSGAVSAVSTAT